MDGHQGQWFLWAVASMWTDSAEAADAERPNQGVDVNLTVKFVRLKLIVHRPR